MTDGFSDPGQGATHVLKASRPAVALAGPDLMPASTGGLSQASAHGLTQASVTGLVQPPTHNLLHPPASGLLLPLRGVAMASGRRSSARADRAAAPTTAAATATASTSAPALAHSAATDLTRTVVLRFLELIFLRRQVRAAFESCVVAKGFRDHAWPGRGSRKAVMHALASRMAQGVLQAELQHLVADGAYAMAHLRCRDGGAPATDRVEIYRVHEGRIAEHWSIGAQPLHQP